MNYKRDCQEEIYTHHGKQEEPIHCHRNNPEEESEQRTALTDTSDTTDAVKLTQHKSGWTETAHK